MLKPNMCLWTISSRLIKWVVFITSPMRSLILWDLKKKFENFVKSRKVFREMEFFFDLPFIQHFIGVMVFVKMNNIIQTIHFGFNSFVNHHFAEELFSFFRFQIKLQAKNQSSEFPKKKNVKLLLFSSKMSSNLHNLKISYGL